MTCVPFVVKNRNHFFSAEMRSLSVVLWVSVQVKSINLYFDEQMVLFPLFDLILINSFSPM